MAKIVGNSSSRIEHISPELTPTQSTESRANLLSGNLKSNFTSERDSTPHSSRHLSIDLDNSIDNKYIEAVDYINEGRPHIVISPAQKDENATSHKPSLNSNSQLQCEELVEASLPLGRRSVQFVRPDAQMTEAQEQNKKSSCEDLHVSHRERKGQSLISKLKALTSASGSQLLRQQNSMSSPTDENFNPTPRSPAFDKLVKLSQILRQEDSDADADADSEETADEGPVANFPRSKKIRLRRPQNERTNGSHTAPTTPGIRTTGDVDFSLGSNRGIPFFNRRATDGFIDHRGHFSEGEGEDRLKTNSSWRRGSHWIINGRGHGILGGLESQQGDSGSSPKRAYNFKRAMTGFGGGLSDGEASTPKRPFFGTDRATTFGAQRWRIIRQGLKILGQKKEEHKVDYLKSAELMAELRAGAPAALMLASMVQRDEHGNKRIPVLLEQVKLQVTDSKSSVEETPESERHIVFRIELEYGSGINRMKWVIHRSLRDFANLHIRYKLQGSSDKYIQLRSDVDSRPKQPRFPKSAFSFFRGVRGLGDSDEDEVEPTQADDTIGDETQSEKDHTRKKKGRSILSHPRRKSSANFFEASCTTCNVQQIRIYNERQRKRLELYLLEMIRWLIFRADSNRLCRFLELSALGVRLAAEGSYHGKEGYLIIQSAKGLNTRRILNPNNILHQHTPKWFLVRHSYLVCVESPENIHIHDVFLVDSKFQILQKRRKLTDLRVKNIIGQAENAATHPQHHNLKMINSERKIKLLAKNERQLRQFEDSIDYMLRNTCWSKPNRFASFAPIRTGIFAQWLVDGRDYMWNVSRAISMAKDVIYIHDWWLSPQLYMRRPAAISQKWRLDRLLQRKAREGVKIFIIIYRNVEAAIPIDSEFTKFSMLDLHPNIFVQRSPNQFKKNQFFYAHHEKICIVDHTVAFIGGIDLCFGRWDTPQHSVVDDKPTGFEQSDLPKDADHCQLWPGKDYSNPRVQDFFQLNEPYAEMYDRSKTPRMPWHDVSMQIVGQPARDLTRHFVQRWNYVLRGRKPTRPTPFLLPPPDYDPADLENLGLTGTCEVQILRSASDWSLGLTETEHSIMTAYCKMIEESEHFVYIENQFFISSCETMNVKIVNKIGDAIVERAVRAHQKNENWRCIILIPLMPGFQNTVDEPEGTSVRLIMQCQFRSICRGEGSIFGRLRSCSIYPQDFVQFYSLRSWGRIGPKKVLVTEQLYIHAKIIIVDDRVALIGSANINERSMLGMRDSECAAIIRDTDMIWSTMDGKPYLVGRFSHTLRMRLMREHLGLDVDSIMEEECQVEFQKEEKLENQENPHSDSTKEITGLSSVSKLQNQPETNGVKKTYFEREDTVVPLPKDDGATNLSSRSGQVEDDGDNVSQKRAIAEPENLNEPFTNDSNDQSNFEQSSKPNQLVTTNQPLEAEISGYGEPKILPTSEYLRKNNRQLGPDHSFQPSTLSVPDNKEIGISSSLDASHESAYDNFNPLIADIKPVPCGKDCMRDPLNDNFFEDIWCRIANNNTRIYRRVFRCNPDSEVQAWSEYRQFVAYGARFAKEQFGESKITKPEFPNSQGKNGPTELGSTGIELPIAQDAPENTEKITLSRPNQSNIIGNSENLAEKEAREKMSRSEIQHMNNQINENIDINALNLPDDGTQLSSQTPENEAFPSLEAFTEEPIQDLEKLNQPPVRKLTVLSIATENNITNSTGNSTGTVPVRRRRRTTKGSRKTFSAGDELLSVADCEELLGLVQGNLVNFPYDWLVKEELNSNWLYQVDQVAPLQIYD